MDLTYKNYVDDFLAQKRIAVAGYSSQSMQPANGIYKKLADSGYEVYAVNPKADSVADVPCYPDLKSIPGKVDAVMICTPPSASASVIAECAELGVKHAWIHRAIDQGSYSPEAEQLAREKGIRLITSGCPLMFLQPDVFHWCMKKVMGWRGRLRVGLGD